MDFLPSFQNAGMLEIYIGESQVAYAQNLSFTDDVGLTPVGGIGAFSYHAIEPTSYMGRGNMTITQYSDRVLKALRELNNNGKHLPGNMINTKPSYDDKGDGNSFLRDPWFNPITLMLGTSFNILVYERSVPTTKQVGTGWALRQFGTPIYRLNGCRLADYALDFNLADITTETVSFLCMSIDDMLADAQQV
jgi:hypothetical protein